jgi:2-methylcitrate dehydratase PrpD
MYSWKSNIWAVSASSPELPPTRLHEGITTMNIASRLASWARELEPDATDLELANRALIDTSAVVVAALREPVAAIVSDAPVAARLSTIGHVLDYDDLHIPSTAHVSVICVPATLAARGGALPYLAGAGVMARVGLLLGWPHYSNGWHATCTAGALGAAVSAGMAFDLDEAGLARAIALAVPAAGGVQRAFGTMAKSLQVGFAAQAGVRAAELVRAGATADPAAVDQWLELLRGTPLDAATVDDVVDATAAVPGGLAIKVFPCCYALQRPICAIQTLKPLDPSIVTRVTVRTPAASIQPLIHHRPDRGLTGKFSLEYGVAAALLDDRTGFESFVDDAVRRPAAQDLLRMVEVGEAGVGMGAGATLHDDVDLLVGRFEADVHLADGSVRSVSLDQPLGAPGRPLSGNEFRAKVIDCCGPCADAVLEISWEGALELLNEQAVRTEAI